MNETKMAAALTPFVAPRLLGEAVTAALAVVQPGNPLRRCGVQGRGNTQCIKNAPHGGRHRYGPPPVNPVIHTPVVRDWTKVPEVPLKSGSKTFTLKVGGPCTLRREGSTRIHGFKVMSIETHPDGRVNVEIHNQKKGLTRIVPLDRIEYKRPHKEGSTK